MDRHITLTDTITGQSATCSVYDIAATLTPWYPDADAEILDVIADLERVVLAERYPDISEQVAYLALGWEWAQPLDLADAADHLGLSYATLRRYRSQDASFPAPDVTVGQSPAWWATTLDAWQAARPGRGAGGGRPRKDS